MEILLIEPEDFIKKELPDYLDSQKYSFIFCKDSNSALDKLKTGTTDLVINGFHYPDNSYDEIFRYMKDNLQIQVPVLTVCTSDDSHYINEIFSSEISDYIRYPFIKSEITKKIDAYFIISRHKKNRQPDESFDKEWLNQIRTVSNDGLFAWNVMTNESYFDPQYYTMAGYEPNEFPPLYDEWTKRVHPDDFPKSQIQGNTYLKGELPDEDDDFRFKRKDGSWMWIRSRIKFVKKDTQGKVIQIIGTHTDVTKERETREELIKLRNYLSSVISSMPTALIGLNNNLTISQWNKSAEKLTGVSSVEALSRTLTDVIPQLEPEKFDIETCLKTKQTKFIRKTIHLDSGEKQYWDITVYPIFNPEVEGAVLLVRDISEKIKIDDLLVQSEKMLSVGGLAAGMAHELNNPLAGIMQTIYVLNNRLCQKKESPANVKAAMDAATTMESIIEFMDLREIPRMFQSILESGIQMAEIINNMLSFSRTDSSKKSLVSLTELIENSIKLASTDYDLKKQYDFKKICITRHFDENLPKLECHKSKIQQVIINLLRNSAQAMNEAGIANPEISINAERDLDRSGIIIEISDNGPGMEDQIQQRIFEPFYTTKPLGSGTGLGLSISYFIITKDHNGEMMVDSIPGKGTKFTIKIPLQQ